jgi:Mce-associated membrane protein
MEGDAGEVSQLNPTGPRADGSSEESQESEESVTTEAKAEQTTPEANAEQTSPEAKAEQTTEANAEETAGEADAEQTTTDARPSLLGRGWLVSVCVLLVLLSAGVAAGGYLALRAHRVSAADARAESVAVQAAKDCVAATQAPDTAQMALSQQKMIECTTGDFNVQATLYSSMLVEAYQAANAQVQVSDMRAAVERHNDDGSIQVLVAFRVKVTNSAAADQEEGYRLRVKMAPADGTYKIAKVDQVAS